MEDPVTYSLQVLLLVVELACITYAAACGVNVGRGNLSRLAQLATGEKDHLPALRMKRGFWMILAGTLLCLSTGYVAHMRMPEAALYGVLGVMCQDRAAKAKEELRRLKVRTRGRRIKADANPYHKRRSSKR